LVSLSISASVCCSFVLAPLERFQLAALAHQRGEELPDLRVQREREPTQLLDVLLSLELVRLHVLL
jgi:hypothetical protein